MEEAIWGGEGLSGEAGMEGGSEGLSREVGMDGGGAGNLGWKWVKWGSGIWWGYSRQSEVEKGGGEKWEWKGVEQAIWCG